MLSMLVVSSVCGAASMHVADDSSLLQSFVRKKQAPPETDSLLQSVQHLADALKKDSTATMTPRQVSLAVVPLRAALDTCLPAFAEQHAHEQKEVELRLREIESCNKSPQFGVAVTARHAKRVAGDLAARDQCNEAHALAIKKETHECGKWTLQHQECKKATTAVEHHAKLCAAKTDAYSEWFCMHYLSCTALAQCHKHNIEAFTSLVADFETGITPRQQQYQSMMHAQCLMQLINSASQTDTFIDEESMASCRDVQVANLTVMPPGPVPEFVECPAPQSSDPQCDAVREELESDHGKVDVSKSRPVAEGSSGLSMAPGFTGTSVKFKLERPTSDNDHGFLAEAAELFKIPA